MRFHEKVGLLLQLAPDVAIVPECARPEVLLRREARLGAGAMAWAGTNPRKGIAVLTFGAWHIEPASRTEEDLGTILALRIEGDAVFHLVAVWNSPVRRVAGRRPLRLAAALETLVPFLSGGPAILAGDFNRALLRRRKDGARVPSKLARRIEAMGLASAYHTARGVRPGEEPEPTLFMNRGRSWSRHVDYCFLDKRTLAALRRVEVGPAIPWILASDHVPLAVEIDSKGSMEFL
jgi:exodeoxyribonuclease-3